MSARVSRRNLLVVSVNENCEPSPGAPVREAVKSYMKKLNNMEQGHEGTRDVAWDILVGKHYHSKINGPLWASQIHYRLLYRHVR